MQSSCIYRLQKDKSAGKLLSWELEAVTDIKFEYFQEAGIEYSKRLGLLHKGEREKLHWSNNHYCVLKCNVGHTACQKAK